MDWIVLLPPFVAIGLALGRVRCTCLSWQVWGWHHHSLSGGHPVGGLRVLVDVVVDVFDDAANARIVLFSLLVGGLIALVQVSGGVRAFTVWAQARGWGRSRRSVELMAWMVGMAIFVESSITSLTVGTLSRPFFDRLKLPRENLHIIAMQQAHPCACRSRSTGGAPSFSGCWSRRVSRKEPSSLLVHSLLYNFFSLFAIVFALFLALSGWSFGAMRRAELRAGGNGSCNSAWVQSDDLRRDCGRGAATPRSGACRGLCWAYRRHDRDDLFGSICHGQRKPYARKWINRSTLGCGDGHRDRCAALCRSEAAEGWAAAADAHGVFRLRG